MDLFVIISFIVLLTAFGLDSCCLAAAATTTTTTFSVMDFGAIGDGFHDDAKAFGEAWEAVCNNGGVASVLVVPNGRNFLLSPVKFQGPCKSSSVHVKVSGNLIAPEDFGAWRGCNNVNSWLFFSDINRLIIHGSGLINGNGESWWKNFHKNIHSTQLKPNKNYGGCNRPTALHFFKCDGLQLTGLRHMNSPRNHISIDHSNYVNISGIHILAPQESPNTDGIDISSSTYVSISQSKIQTGDDCVAINNGSSDIRITRVSCGPGHGISVGSLGAHGSYATVERVFVKHCKFYGSQNGVRIKTWPGGSGYARTIHFENITLQDVKNPIIIDQFYCDGEFKCGDQGVAVEVSDVTYKGVKGTTVQEKAIQLICSKSRGCNNIKMQEINITSSVAGAKTHSTCKNVQGTSFLTTPTVPCLSHDTKNLYIS